MASSCESLNNNTPSPANRLAAGHPAPPAATTAPNNEARPLPPPPDHPFRDFFLLQFCDFFLTAILLVAFLCFVAYFAFRPLPPEFRVVSASVSHLNLSQSELTAHWFFELNVKNPNEKLSVRYERLVASVFCGYELELAMTQMPPHLQGPNGESTVQFQLGVISEYVGDDVVKKISKERDRGSVGFGVRVLALVRFSSGSWRTREHFMRVYCDPVRIGNFGLNGTGTSLAQSQRCDVYL